MTTPQKITIYHSPDADDAFMFHGLVSGAISEPGFIFDHALSDIETLNRRARKGELDVTAVSVHAYAYLADEYAILSCGASMGGEHYGPRIVAKSQIDFTEYAKAQKTLTVGIPGELTSATLATKLFFKEKNVPVELKTIYFESIGEAVLAGEVDVGVLIHEGQLTYQQDGLTMLQDLGSWWWQKTALPLPLGVNVVKKSLGPIAIAATARALKASIEYSLAQRNEALTYALSYGRGLSVGDADTFVGMYVNEITVDMGDAGRKSIALFLAEGAKHGFVPTQFDKVESRGIQFI
jgi:1,4-dihydroxy-6-naphthoate synthase